MAVENWSSNDIDDYRIESEIWTSNGVLVAEVSLPHQCEEWCIAMGELTYVTRELEIFIQRATEVLTALRSTRGG